VTLNEDGQSSGGNRVEKYVKFTKTQKVQTPGGYVKETVTFKGQLHEHEEYPGVGVGMTSNAERVFEVLRQEGLRELGFW
jgi:hypothetical protein